MSFKIIAVGLAALALFSGPHLSRAAPTVSTTISTYTYAESTTPNGDLDSTSISETNPTPSFVPAGFSANDLVLSDEDFERIRAQLEAEYRQLHPVATLGGSTDTSGATALAPDRQRPLAEFRPEDYLPDNLSSEEIMSKIEAVHGAQDPHAGEYVPDELSFEEILRRIGRAEGAGADGSTMTPQQLADHNAHVQRMLEDANRSGPEECSICLEAMEEDGGSTQLRCKHKFHSGCILEWQNSCSSRDQRQVCPNCRDDPSAR